jgi:hypothetical protein
MSVGKTSPISLSERSSYKRRGKPQRAMAEIRRMLLQRISGQIEKEALPASARTNISLSNPRRFQ